MKDEMITMVSIGWLQFNFEYSVYEHRMLILQPREFIIQKVERTFNWNTPSRGINAISITFTKLVEERPAQIARHQSTVLQLPVKVLVLIG